jgi:Ca2+:H+ antiporter
VPVLVLMSFVLGPSPMPFVLNGFELAAILIAITIANQVTQEGESNWHEGILLLSVYAVFALAFAFA